MVNSIITLFTVVAKLMFTCSNFSRAKQWLRYEIIVALHTSNAFITLSVIYYIRALF